MKTFNSGTAARVLLVLVAYDGFLLALRSENPLITVLWWVVNFPGFPLHHFVGPLVPFEAIGTLITVEIAGALFSAFFWAFSAGYVLRRRYATGQHTIRLPLILAVSFALAGICCGGLRIYEGIITPQTLFWLPDPCRPKLLAAAGTNALPDDETIQRRLTGAWWHSGSPIYLDDKLIWYVKLVTVASNGEYACHYLPVGGVIYSNYSQGHWRVKDGLLLNTITNYNRGLTNELVWHIYSNQVIRITDRELVYRMQPYTDLVMFRRVRQFDR